MSSHKEALLDFNASFYFLDSTCKILHREDGPACEYANGYKEWYRNGLRHREDGPACEWEDGSYEWFYNGKLHRLDGPAIKHSHGEFWFYNGKGIDCSSQEEFEKLLKLKVFW